jgi:putative nucleotidyltransferase with HDIG domain
LTLSKIIDARDPDAAGHATKVADYATAIAVEVGLVERVEHIRQAALLHDIGKLGIPERILHKPARLDAEEYAIIKTHAALGAEFLETCQGLRHLAPLIKHHHERWDGDGYPDGLRGEQIPMEARILAVCDAVDAMGSDRPYHQAIALDEIVAELERCAEAQFDPAVVQAFMRIAERRGENFSSSTQEMARPSGSPSRGKEPE